MSYSKFRPFQYALISVVFTFSVILTTGCTQERYNWQNHIENYDMEDIEYLFLEKGESITFNYTEHFADTPITIDECDARSSNESVFTVNGNTITAVGISKGLKIEDLILLSKRLGHRDVKETLNTYSHLFPNAQKKILESIDEGAEM